MSAPSHSAQQPVTGSVCPENSAHRVPDLSIYAVSSDSQTAPALLIATASLAQNLGARVELLFAEVVPYPVPLERPHVKAEVLASLLGRFAQTPVADTAIEIYLCRDGQQTIREQLPPESVVVLQRHSPVWRSPVAFLKELVFARRLRRDGHHVVFVKVDPQQFSHLEDIVKVKPYGDIQYLYSQRRP